MSELSTQTPVFGLSTLTRMPVTAASWGSRTKIR